jgi:hypothetical protein
MLSTGNVLVGNYSYKKYTVYSTANPGILGELKLYLNIKKNNFINF